MKQLERRIKAIEREISKQENQVLTILKVKRKWFVEGATPPGIDEPVEDWITYKKALEKHEKQYGAVCLFIIDPFKEYEAQHDMPEGTFEKTGLKGQIPFQELLEKVKMEQNRTKRNKKAKNEQS